MWILMILYNIISIPFFFSCLICLLVQSLKKKENLRERFRGIKKTSSDNVVWIHAASVGEVKAASSLIQEIKDQYPASEIFVSTITKTGHEEAKRIENLKEIFYFPFDFIFLLFPLLRKFKGAKLILIETEIWPNLVFFGRSMGLDIYLVNGRLSNKNYPSYYYLRFFFKRILNMYSALCLQSFEDYKRFLELGVKKELLHLPGNLKIDNAKKGQSKPNFELLEEMKLMDKPFILAASTHQGEERVILGVFADIQKEFPDIILILAPRHIERALDLKTLAYNYDFSVTRRTKISQELESQVIILDTMGELTSLYPAARSVFIGASIVPLGGHNPLEALGVPLFFGPHMDNCQEVVDLLLTNDLARQIGCERELCQETMRILKGEADWVEDLDKRASKFLKAHSGATKKTVDILFGKIDEDSRACICN